LSVVGEAAEVVSQQLGRGHKPTAVITHVDNDIVHACRDEAGKHGVEHRVRSTNKRCELNIANGRIPRPHVDRERLGNRIDRNDVLGHGDRRQNRTVKFANFKQHRGVVEGCVDTFIRDDLGDSPAIEAQDRLATRETTHIVGWAIDENTREAHFVIFHTPAEAEAFVFAFTEKLLVRLCRTDITEAIQWTAIGLLRTVGLGNFVNQHLGRGVIGNIDTRRQHFIPEVPVI